jgi:hypothetical protein
MEMPRNVLGRLAVVDEARAQQLLTNGTLVGLVAAAFPFAWALPRGHSPEVSAWFMGLVGAALLFALPRVPWLIRLAAVGVIGFVVMTTIRPVPEVLMVLLGGGLGLLLAFEHGAWWRRLLALAGPTLGAWWGLKVLELLSRSYLEPFSHLGPMSGLALGLFIALGACLALLRWTADDIEPRLAAEPRVEQTWVRLRKALQRLPEGEPRARIAAAARASAERWLTARSEATEVKASLDEDLESETRLALERLEVRLTETTDDAMADSYRQLARVHRDTLEQFATLRQRKERLDARAATEAAWLETAAFTVELAPRDTSHLPDLAGRLVALVSR